VTSQASSASPPGGVGTTILVAEDDDASRLALARSLERNGYTVLQAHDGQDAVDVFASSRVDLVVLDVGMPQLDGFAVLQRIRQVSDVPVIFLTGRAEEVDRVVGFELGADDYVLKPYSLRELVARVRARLRRPRGGGGGGDGDTGSGGAILEYDDLRIDPRAHEVHVGDRLVDLTAREYELLVYLAARPREVFTRGQLLESVWGTTYRDPATVTEHVRRVRVKVEAPAGRSYISTLRGTGYRFDP